MEVLGKAVLTIPGGSSCGYNFGRWEAREPAAMDPKPSYEALQLRIQALEAQLDQGARMAQEAAQRAQDAAASPAQARQQLPHPPLFDGKRASFKAWAQQIKSKLQLEGNVIGSEAHQVAYIASRLGPIPQAAAVTWQEHESSQTPLAFLNYLAGIYADPQEAQKALVALNQVRQGSQLFSTFLPQFESLLAQADALCWPDAPKINLLRQALSPQLAQALMYQAAIPTGYRAFADQLGVLATNLGAHQTIQRASNNVTTQYAPANPDAMEWVATAPMDAQQPHQQPRQQQKAPRFNKAAREAANAQLKGKRALWVSKEELERRRQAKVCFRCARPGCGTKVCPLLPPIKPTTEVQAAPLMADSVLFSPEDLAQEIAMAALAEGEEGKGQA